MIVENLFSSYAQAILIDLYYIPGREGALVLVWSASNPAYSSPILQ